MTFYVAYFHGLHYTMNYSPYAIHGIAWADHAKHIALVKKLYGPDAKAFVDWLPNPGEAFFRVPNVPGDWSVEND